MFQTSLQDRLDELSKKNPDLSDLPDFTAFVTWDRLEDALKGIRETLEKSTHDAAMALASTRDNRQNLPPVERPRQAVSDQSLSCLSHHLSNILVCYIEGIHLYLSFIDHHTRFLRQRILIVNHYLVKVPVYHRIIYRIYWNN